MEGSSNQRVIDVQASLKQEIRPAPVLHCPDHASAEDAWQDTSDGQNERRTGCGE